MLNEIIYDEGQQIYLTEEPPLLRTSKYFAWLMIGYALGTMSHKG